MVNRTRLQERYELKEPLGRGGMGVVYKAFDTLMNREVALKTILDLENPSAIDLFYKEWGILAAMVHPNIVSIYDIGEFEHEGMRKPFFVMPLLPGVTIDKLIREGNPRLTVEVLVDILSQASRGLNAAHELGLVHRDVKPSNIFVMNDNSVKIIDFGIARLVSTGTKTSLKGTLHYMAPEQFQMKPPTPQSDQFALAVVCYEALTRRKPFQGSTDTEIVESILRHSPPPCSEVNANVSFALSQVIHKAMAKQPWHRFFNAREFGDAMERALRGEALEYFDSSKIKPRLERAVRSFETADYDFASEVLGELEAEGHIDQDIQLLRGQLDSAVRHKRIQQLLENARRFFEASEYPLALRKVQEALELDPADTGTLALKQQIEKERREKKIEEWLRLAGQHMDNSAFRQSREALQNVLTLKPNETSALQMISEITRREEEQSRIRDEKAQFYQLAKQAWERGEVSSALTKLEALVDMERDKPDSDSGRVSNYQGFYNQVRSEHDNLKNLYDEARQQLTADDFPQALKLCDQALVKYPNHALFQSLKFDIEERRRQRLSAVIAETDRRVDAEPDLDKRLALLDEAIRLYPGEAHFERARQLVRDKRDLVNSITGKARLLEEKQQYNEALDQWQILRSIHESYPGLAYEIQRLMKRRDEQALETSKARWVEQIDRNLEKGDYDRAMTAVQDGLREFPKDKEILELEKLAAKHQQRASQAEALIEQAREANEAGDTAGAAGILREANQLDPRNGVVRTVLANTLLEQARAAVEAVDDGAEPLLQEVLALEPNQPAAQSLLTRISDRKREEYLSWCLAEARRLQTEADLDAALAVVEQGLAIYPQELRLVRLRDTLRRAKAEANSHLTRPVLPATPAIAVPLPPLPPPEKRVPPPDSHPPRKKPWMPIIAAACGIVGIMGGIVYTAKTLRQQQPSPAPAPQAKFQIRAEPAGAQITVDGTACASPCDAELTPGMHKLSATIDGYRPAALDFTAQAGNPPAAPLLLTLEAIRPAVSVATDLGEGEVQLDGEAPSKLAGGELELKDLPNGDHTITFTNAAYRGSVPLRIEAGVARMAGEPAGQNVKVTVVNGSGPSAKLYSSWINADITVDGVPAGKTTAGGIDLNGLEPGSRLIILSGQGMAPQRIHYIAGAPLTIAHMAANPNVGVLSIQTGVDNVNIILNGERNRRTTLNGRVVIYLVPRKYVVRVEKEGFSTPPDQTVDIQREKEAKLDFHMQPLAQRVTVSLRNSVGGAEILLDGSPAGTVRDDGSANLTAEPGRHTITVRKEGYKPLQTVLNLDRGKNTDLSAPLESLMGALHIEAPAGVKLSLRREGEAIARAIGDTQLRLPEGTYTVTAQAVGSPDASTTVRVAANRTVTATLTFKALKAAAPKPHATAFTLADWEKTGVWNRENNMLVHTGGDYFLAPAPPANGVYQMRVILLKGRRLELVVNFLDGRNHILYQIDKSDFHRIEIENGKKQQELKVKHGLDRDAFNNFSIAITGNTVRFAVQRGGAWDSIDTFTKDGGSLTQGRFGFHIPGRDEIGITDFRFDPK